MPALLLKAGLLVPNIGYAQGYVEGIGLSYEVLPLQQKSGSEATFRADVFRANIIAPVAVAADTSHAFLAGLNLEALHFSGSRPGFAVQNVYGITPVLGYRQRLSARTELTALALPSLNSDLREVRGADVTWGGVLRAAYRANPRRAYRLTVGYRQQFYGPQYVLLLGLDWRLGERWRAFGDLPTTFNISYAATAKVNVGFNLNGINTAYRLLNNDQYFQYQQAHYGLFAETYLSSHWAVRATAAYAGIRRLDVFAKDDQWPATIDYIGLGTAPTPLNPRLEKGLAFRLALSYRVPAP
ncbi:DUF6268 family outer membrane beta-barrel protein [Hymenobacter properus]|uniref:DUF6268 domain-containing protein n=1 Tax=Hymenobacter properus TaxID=2791026 RepID=A0A931FMM8_9BACT|nr:DUF6268 family outer membrane beta-barrel protein [Hymenobacter properus]MBF9144150.1 hypothetical protein [Hymenobacter properus]MBR7722966.1 hypothetical protein [Microvirga sp. SRT04]